jgi:hypothetical protein
MGNLLQANNEVRGEMSVRTTNLWIVSIDIHIKRKNVEKALIL